MFRCIVGVPPLLCTGLSNQLIHSPNLQIGMEPKHLLWALHFLRPYRSDDVNSAI